MTTNVERYLRLNKVLEIIPVSRATWYAGVKVGRYPSPVKLSPRAVAWMMSDIDALIVSLKDGHIDLADCTRKGIAH